MHSPNRIRGIARIVSLLLLVGSGSVPIAAQSEDPEAAARRLLVESERALERGDTEAALAELATIVERLPGSALRPGALLRSATLLVGSGRADEALALLERLESEHGDAPEAAAGAVLTARIELPRARQRADLERLRGDLRRLATLFPAARFPHLAARAEARVLAGEIALLLGDADAAASDFVAVLEDEPGSPWTAQARLGFAEVLRRQGRWRLAADELQRLRLEASASDPGAPIEVATRRLTLIDRLQLRPQIGDRSWPRASRIAAERLPLDRPVSLAVSDAGEVVVTEERQSQSWRLPAATSTATQVLAPAGSRPFFDREGRVWFAFSDGLQSPDGTRMLSFPRPDGKDRPLSKIVGAGRSGLGEWFLIDRDLSEIAVYDAQGRAIGTVAEGLIGDPVDIAADGRGGVWVLDRRPARLLNVGLDRQVTTTVAVAARRPTALDVDPFGNVYLLDAAEPAVLVLSPSGELRQRIAGALLEAVELTRPEDLAVDGSGRVFLLQRRPAGVVVLE